MNRAYRLVWNAFHQTWQAVGENARGRSKAGRAGRVVLVSLMLPAGVALAGDLPEGGVVSAGSGSISQNGANLVVQQDSARLAVDWQRFSIGQGNTVTFVQPSSSSVALNRVLGSDVSVIQGALQANGQVFLLNPNGVLFTSTAQVNVGGLLASTLQMRNEDFLQGHYVLEGDSAAVVSNAGSLKAADGGMVALVAAKVVNTGEIQADQGQVLLGAGRKLTLDLGGPARLEVDEAAVDALVDNGGAIRANGGMVLLTAKAAGELLPTVINQTGTIEAHTLTTGATGQIVLLADNGTAEVGGTLDASGAIAGHGGEVVATGARVHLQANALVDVSGAEGGGQAHIGGGWQGQDAAIANAQQVRVDSGAVIRANATVSGQGGTVSVWSDVATAYAGHIEARGGAQGGDGGQVEVSGKQALGVLGTVDTSAPQGQAGLLLLDPNTIRIVDGASGQTGTYSDWSNHGDTSSYVIPETVLESLTGDVVLTAVTDIIIEDLSDNVLNLSATNMYFYANDESSPSSSGGFTMRDVNDTIRLNQGAGSQIVFQGGNISSRNTGTTAASIYLGNVETLGADVVFNTKRSSAATPMVVNGTITTHGGSISVAPGTRFGLTNSNVVDVSFLGQVDTGGGNFTSNMTGTVQINGGLNLGSGTATFGGTGTQINSLVQSTADITISAPLSFGAGAGISTSGTITFDNTAAMLAGGSLTLTASNFVFNSAFSGNNADITLRPYDTSTSVDIGSAGSPAASMLISSAALAQLSGFDTITIGRTDGTGTTRVNSDVSVAASGQIELINDTIQVVDGALGNTTGDVVLTANHQTIGNQVTAQGGAGSVTLQQLTAANGITLGSGLDPNLAQINAATLVIGRADGGDITFDSDMSTSASTVHLRSGGNITAAAGGVSASSLAITAGGDVTLSSATFDFTTLALDVGGTTLARSSQAFDVGTVDGVVGITAGSAPVTLESTAASGTVTASQAIRASQLALIGSATGFSMTNAGNAVDTLAARTGGGLAFGNSTALTVGTVGSTVGAQAQGAVDVSTSTGNLSVQAHVSTADAGSSAIVLNAGVASAAGSSTGGDVVVGSGVGLSTGVGGRVTVYTGSLAGSTAVADLAGAGSNRFRYGSDEASSAYTATLTDGLYVIYRERPTLSVSPGAQTITYGNSASAFTGTVSGFRNGDTADSLSGTAIWLVGGNTSGAGHLVAGAHEVSYVSGLSSAVGYALADASGSTGELTVNKATLGNVSGGTVTTRVYDGSTLASFDATGATVAGVLSGDTVLADFSNASATFDDAHAGTGKTAYVTGVSLSGADAQNYEMASTGSTTHGDITARTVTVQAESTEKALGQADPVLRYSADAAQGTHGLLAGDSLAGDLSRVAGEAQGSYAITQGSLGNPDYLIDFVPGLLTIHTPVPVPSAVQSAQATGGTTAAGALLGAPLASASSKGLELVSLPQGQDGSDAIAQAAQDAVRAGGAAQGAARVFVVGGGIRMPDEAP